MSDDRRGISLRKKRSTKPKISAPKQISAPIQAGSGPSAGPPPGLPPNLRAGRGAAPSPTPSDRSDRDRPRPSDERSRGPPAAATAGLPGANPRPRAAQQSERTAEMVKRRYSTRFTNLPQDFSVEGGAPPVPAMPGIPAQYMGAGGRPGTAGSRMAPPSRDGPRASSEGRRGDKIGVDLKKLRDPNLRPEQYVASLLADASEQDIRDYQDELRKVKNRTSTDLQHNVYQNRTQFIKISKEAEKLKGEMRTLRTLMTELTVALGQATSAGEGSSGDPLGNGSLNGSTESLSTPSTTSSRRANRSSVANLEALWNTHLQTLWKRVEGSQKFLPAIPGRHIVYESGHWVELNAATWKPRRRVWIILLNDHLLIAAEKKRAELAATQQSARDVKTNGAGPPGGAPTLVAQRCWSLQDVQVSELSSSTASSAAAAAAISIRVGNDSFTYAATGGASDPRSEKSTFVSTFRKAAEDIRRATEETSRGGGSFLPSNRDLAEAANAGGGAGASSTGSGTSAGTSGGVGAGAGSTVSINSSTVFVDVDGKKQSIRWVEGQLDELDIAIALQRFEDAVARVERLRRLAKSIRGNAVAQEVVAAKVAGRAEKLAGVLTRQLVQTHSWLGSMRSNVDWLVRLGYEDRARERYLEAREEVLLKRTRQCAFTGSIPTYTFQLSFITFTLIRNTLSIFNTCFPPQTSSAAVKWAKDRVDAFNANLQRQLGAVPDLNPETREQCIEQARAHADMLKEVGLDFRGLVGREVVDGGVGTENGLVGLGVS
ncbi:hypothetical protein BDY21DRAFT_318400 [Lineolata rhizophorae]|uniref:Exocyst complex component EXO84 n=1 Tax=Lineolata rhizophorae TaxID=578093 RepID=A0A6A6P5R4_9PEZI|nr:hypothetical protein BDY21DRAFT_318400 [Lineolata rhizophorae]